MSSIFTDLRIRHRTVGWKVLMNYRGKLPTEVSGLPLSVDFSQAKDSVQLLSRVQLFVTPCTAAHQASLSITKSRSLLEFMSIKSVMPSNHLILYHPLLLPLSTFPGITVFSNESFLRIRWPKYLNFSFSINPSNEYSGLKYSGHKESWALKNWCFWNVVLEKTLESPLDFKEIQPVHPKGNQSWIFIGRTDAKAETPILWPPDVKRWLMWKDPDAGKDWRREEKGTTEDEMVGWHHWLKGHEFE